jgi:hypothetical protein
MLDRFVFGVYVCDSFVGRPLVGINGFGIVGGVLSDKTVQGLPIRTSNDLKANVPAPLHRPYHDGLIAFVATSFALHLAAYECFVNFYDALQELRVNFLEGIAYAMGKIPSGFVGDPEGALELVGRDSLFGFGDEVNCQKPLPERKVSIVEDGIGSNRELVAA